ncbi:acetylxylan esterase [Streptomyces sp. CT1-17]|uniref:acetylxylan esterase n=1 Tax=Streptomyces TaxID=1883 RepID=UPI001413DBAA|nr:MULTISPECIES: acetylxylan esterase [Streptomyces]MBZ6292745.1 acetylxylan esterase [Streptomyces olivaceus]MBZ6306801.1 acetylxylan esterase [Streptomyces olivaceus]MBZ6320696.1 acetylxylan esterase [Streptomyces olivaceus]MBZ6327912.1 acetylxylan esterase [Streptomyces olivaceus]MCC2266735.1 acetylxylan esterase [Streptomyces sp. CT1-17]
MPLTDLTLAECLALRPDLHEPADLDAFWDRTLREARAGGGTPRFAPVDTGLTEVATYDVTVPGFAGEPVRGWLHLPVRASGPLGCVVEFLGYGRGRGLAHEQVLWATAGHAHLVMDTRGQGWSTAGGDTPDTAALNGTVPGFLTRGVESPHDHYYRRVFTDAVRFTEAARAHPAVDADRVVVTGVSQGGGIALAVAGLLPGLAGAMPDVPFLCDIRRGATIAARPPYTEVAEYLRLHRDRTETVFTTLSYVDAALLAARATAPSLFSVAMMDEVCPPSTGFAAYHRYGGPKDLRVYEFNGHEGGGGHHRREQLAWLGELFATPDRATPDRATPTAAPAPHVPRLA